jgi:23S rRNA pseudouridine2604 synthase
MTNDGRVTDRLLSPIYTHEKEYVVKVEPNISDKFLELIQNGVHFDKFVSKKCLAWRLANKKNIFHIVLTEGKKRQIRRMCEALHHQVIDLKRIRVMNIELGNIKEGEYREIKGKELNEFLKLLKLI